MLTQTQRAERVRYLGSSDAPAVLGVDPYRSAADVWLEKTERAGSDRGNNADTHRGNWLEPALLDFAADRLGKQFERHIMLVAEDDLRAANYDGLGSDRTFVVEAKSAAAADPDEWGDDGTDQVPERVLVQVAHQMDIAGPQCVVGYVPLIVPGYRRFEFRMYEIPRNQELVSIVSERGAAFMRDFVRADKRPDDFRPSLEILKRMQRTPNKVITVADSLVTVCQAAREQAASSAKAKEQADAALIAALGDAEMGVYSGGQVTYLLSQRKGYVVEPSSFRSLRFKAAKGL